MKIPVRLAAILVTVTVASACSSGAVTTSESGQSVEFEKKDPLTIGYSVYDTQAPYFQAYMEGVEAEAKANGIKVVIADQKQQQQAQVSGSADLINQGISALIVSPVQPEALPSTIQAAHSAKIPLVVGDVGATGDYDAYINSDNEGGGKLAGQYMVDKAGASGGKVGIVALPSGNAAGKARVDGFTTALEDDGQLAVAGEVDGAGTADGGFSAAQDLLAANPDLVGIYAANDDMAQGVAKAVADAGKNPRTFVTIGFNGDPPALDLVEKGQLTATVAQDPYAQGQLAVQVAMQLLDGDEPDYSDAGTKTFAVPVEVVDAANLSALEASRAEREGSA